jgi:ribosomal protein L7Ae-like RNA K-turn-binding protein
MKTLSTLGLAKRARACKIGETQVYESIQSIHLIFLASDVGPATKNKVEGKCHHYQIPIIEAYTREQLSQSVGTKNTVVIGITDQGFSALFKEEPHGENHQGNPGRK